MQEAVEAFARLPAAQYSTSWVLCCIGRAYYEMVDYPQAARVFEWARQVDPTRLQVWTLRLFYCINHFMSAYFTPGCCSPLF